MRPFIFVTGREVQGLRSVRSVRESLAAGPAVAAWQGLLASAREIGRAHV